MNQTGKSPFFLSCQELHQYSVSVWSFLNLFEECATKTEKTRWSRLLRYKAGLSFILKKEKKEKLLVNVYTENWPVKQCTYLYKYYRLYNYVYTIFLFLKIFKRKTTNIEKKKYFYLIWQRGILAKYFNDKNKKKKEKHRLV